MLLGADFGNLIKRGMFSTFLGLQIGNCGLLEMNIKIVELPLVFDTLILHSQLAGYIPKVPNVAFLF